MHTMWPAFREGPLVHPRRRDPIVGRLCPQPRVGGALLDDLLGTGFAIVYRGPDRIATYDSPTREFFDRLGTTVVRVDDLPDGAALARLLDRPGPTPCCCGRTAPSRPPPTPPTCAPGSATSTPPASTQPKPRRSEARLMTEDLLWPDYATPDDLATIEAVPLEKRGLPESTYALLTRAASRWPDRTAITVLPDAARWREPHERTFAELLADVHRYANLFHDLGIRRGDAVALMAPNSAELITATLAAQLAGIAAPLGSGLSRQHLAELLRRSGARVLVTAGPELAPDTWDTARRSPATGCSTLSSCSGPPRRRANPSRCPPSTASASGTSMSSPPPWTRPGSSATRPDPPTWPRCSTPAGRPAPRNWRRTPTPTRSPTRGCWPPTPCSTPRRWSSPPCRCSTSTPSWSPCWPAVQGAAGGVGRAARLPRPRAVRNFWKIVEHYRIAAMSAVPTVYAVLAQRPVDADISSLR